MKFRTAIFYKDYFEKFFLKQSEKTKAKIIWTIQLKNLNGYQRFI